MGTPDPGGREGGVDRGKSSDLVGGVSTVPSVNISLCGARAALFL